MQKAPNTYIFLKLLIFASLRGPQHSARWPSSAKTWGVHVSVSSCACMGVCVCVCIRVSMCSYIYGYCVDRHQFFCFQTAPCTGLIRSNALGSNPSTKLQTHRVDPQVPEKQTSQIKVLGSPTNSQVCFNACHTIICRDGQNHPYVHVVCTELMAGESPNIRSYTAYV